MVIVRPGNVNDTKIVADGRSNVAVTGIAVYEVREWIIVSHSTKVVGSVPQSVITAVHTNVNAVGVRRSVIRV